MKSTPKTNDAASQMGSGDVSVKTTLLRTLTLVVLTLLLAASVRVVPPVGRGMQAIVGTSAWQSLYHIFGLESGMAREQLILVGIVGVCFVVALILQTLGIVAWRAYRRRA